MSTCMIEINSPLFFSYFEGNTFIPLLKSFIHRQPWVIYAHFAPGGGEVKRGMCACAWLNDGATVSECGRVWWGTEMSVVHPWKTGRKHISPCAAWTTPEATVTKHADRIFMMKRRSMYWFETGFHNTVTSFWHLEFCTYLAIWGWTGGEGLLSRSPWTSSRFCSPFPRSLPVTGAKGPGKLSNRFARGRLLPNKHTASGLTART